MEYTLDTTSDYIRRDYVKTTGEGDDSVLGSILIFLIIFGLISCMCENSYSTSYNYNRYPRYSSSNDFWSGAAAGYAVGRSSGSGWGSSRSSWGGGGSSWGGGSSISSGFATTSRR